MKQNEMENFRCGINSRNWGGGAFSKIWPGWVLTINRKLQILGEKTASRFQIPQYYPTWVDFGEADVYVSSGQITFVLTSPPLPSVTLYPMKGDLSLVCWLPKKKKALQIIRPTISYVWNLRASLVLLRRLFAGCQRRKKPFRSLDRQ